MPYWGAMTLHNSQQMAGGQPICAPANSRRIVRLPRDKLHPDP
jgi:hypothetical protein